jgi:hypothetical protein
MEKNAGVWIDHAKAVIVQLTETGHEIRSVIADEQVPEAEGSGEGEVSGGVELKYNSASHCNAYYEKIIAALHGAEAVLIMGPGEEKVELSVRLPGNSLGEHIAGIITEPSLSDDQIVAKVCKHFR